MAISATTVAYFPELVETEHAGHDCALEHAQDESDDDAGAKDAQLAESLRVTTGGGRERATVGPVPSDDAAIGKRGRDDAVGATTQLRPSVTPASTHTLIPSQHPSPMVTAAGVVIP